MANVFLSRHLPAANTPRRDLRPLICPICERGHLGDVFASQGLRIQSGGSGRDGPRFVLKCDICGAYTNVTIK